MRPVVRSLTSASPPGRKATPHGTWSPVTIVRAALAPALSRASEPQATTSETTRSRIDRSKEHRCECWQPTLDTRLAAASSTRDAGRPLASTPYRRAQIAWVPVLSSMFRKLPRPASRKSDQRGQDSRPSKKTSSSALIRSSVQRGFGGGGGGLTP